MIERSIQIAFPHRILFTRDVFAPDNRVLRDLVAAGSAAGERPARLTFFLDRGAADAVPGLAAQIEAYCARWPGLLALAAPPTILPGGEAAKNDWGHVEGIWDLLNRHAVDRHSYVVAVGGGAVLDLVGFAAATAHRGIRHIRMPTTTLSQADGGVGVKNGVNYHGKKNWVGTFAVPFAVVNDFTFIPRLPERERRAGVIEAIKVALIRDRAFFEAIEAEAPRVAMLENDVLEQVIRRCAELHVDHIAGGGDPFEFGSARPLDFGHWVAHKLEQVSGFSVGHGEAVAIGMAVDLLYSVRVGLLPAAEAQRILTLLESVGFELYSDYLEAEEFREHLGGRLTITLIPEIGTKVEVHEMDAAEVDGALADLAERSRVRV